MPTLLRPPVFLAVCALAAAVGFLSPRLAARTGAASVPAAPSVSSRTVLGRELLERGRERREDLGLARLDPHPPLEVFLDGLVESGRGSDLKTVLDEVEREFPRFGRCAAVFLEAGSESAMRGQFETWPELADPESTHVAVRCFEAARGLTGCLAVIGSIVPELRLPMRCADTPRFFDSCAFCGHGHVVAAWQGASVLRCPGCRRAYDLLGADSDGFWRRATEFVAPAASGEGKPGLEGVAEVWREVVTRYRYRSDAQRLAGGDSWNLPEETLRHGFGDCDDTSILLAHLLLSRGHEARVVLGEWNGSGHAWVVARVDGTGYLLESTLPGVKADALPPRIEDVALDYFPAVQFDGGRLYFKKFEDWTGEYWSAKAWTEVEVPVRANSVPG